MAGSAPSFSRVVESRGYLASNRGGIKRPFSPLAWPASLLRCGCQRKFSQQFKQRFYVRLSLHQLFQQGQQLLAALRAQPSHDPWAYRSSLGLYHRCFVHFISCHLRKAVVFSLSFILAALKYFSPDTCFYCCARASIMLYTKSHD